MFLEAKVVKVGNEVIRNLLLEKAHLIPPELLNDADKLIEHYDFPSISEKHFQEKYHEYWQDLYKDV